MQRNPLYAIADTHLLQGRMLASAEAALANGCDWIQYRDKSGDAIKRQAEASQLLELCRHYSGKLLINDDVSLALALGADGVHLGQGDGDPAEARQRLGDSALIGVTCHDSLALAESARQAGASYVAFGRFFRSHTKPEAPPAPLSLLSRAREHLGPMPIIAIGGITAENGGAVIDAGADRLAVSHDLFSAPDIGARTRAFATLVS